MTEIEVAGLGGGVQDNSGGGAQAPAGHIHGPAEVSPTGVGLREARHPGPEEKLSAGGEVPTIVVPPGCLIRSRGTHDGQDNHIISGQTCGARDT